MGLIDLHVHAGPSVMPRELDGAEMLKEAIKDNYSAFIIKDHYFPTMMTAEIIQKHLGNGKCRVYGGLALNNSVGGLNLKAVDTAYAMGARIIWMPTVSSERHKIMHEGHGLAFPGSKGMSIEEKTICYIDKNGELQKEVRDILNYLKDKQDLILATGHGSRDEIDALIKAAHNMGIKRILVNHPQYMIGASVEDMVAWSKLGAFIELNATVFVPTSKFYVNKIEEAAEIINLVGVDKIVLDSDYGQNKNGSPVEGFKTFIDMLTKECNLNKDEIKTITEVNPAWLLGL